MKDNSINDPFYKNLQGQIDRTEKKSDWYRNYYYFTRILTIIFATVITIASGWKTQKNPDCIFNLILMLGTASTALLSLDTIFQFELKKSVYKLILVELRNIRSEFVFHYQREDQTASQSEHHKLIITSNNQLKERLFPKYQSAMSKLISLIEAEKESSVKLSDLQHSPAKEPKS